MNKILQWAIEHPLKAAYAACYLTMPLPVYCLMNGTFDKPLLYEDPNFVQETIGLSLIIVSPILSLVTSGMCFTLMNRLNYSKETIKLVNDLEKEVEKEAPPTTKYAGKHELPLTLKDYLFRAYATGSASEFNADTNANYGRKHKNPLFLMEAAEGYLEKRRYEDALLCLRDALDILDGKKLELGWAYKFGNRAIQSLSFIVEKFARIGDPRQYLARAIQLTAMDADTAWKYSRLAKKIATRTKNPLETETYIFDALLARAQNRTDTEQTWQEAIALILQTGTPQRLGESRNPVWVMANNKFLSSTIVFKGNKKRKTLEDEIRATQTLEQILGETATTPTPLYLTNEPHTGLYVYAMRYIAGQLLQDQLLAGNNSSIPDVIEILARIHAKYPTTGLPRLDINKKHEEKLNSPNLRLPPDLVALLMQGLEPVTRTLQTEEHWTANKDAHPEQWQITGERIGVLDAEITNTHPPLMDLANLLEYTTTFTPKQRREYLETYLQHARQQGLTLTTNPHQQYCAAVIHRMISLIDAWSAPERTPKHPERTRLADNALTAARQLQNETQDETYHKLTKGLERLKTMLDVG